MRPRTLAILTVVLLVGSLGMRQLVEHFGLLPVSEEAILKKAVALKLNYYDGGKLKTQEISDPAEVAEVLARLQIQPKDDRYYGYGFDSSNRVSASVEFTFPDGSRRGHALNGPSTRYVMSSAFYHKLAEIASKREGHVIDLSKTAPPVPVAAGVDDAPQDNNWNKKW